jgi:hypothetical protein
MVNLWDPETGSVPAGVNYAGTQGGDDEDDDVDRDADENEESA